MAGLLQGIGQGAKAAGGAVAQGAQAAGNVIGQGAQAIGQGAQQLGNFGMQGLQAAQAGMSNVPSFIHEGGGFIPGVGDSGGAGWLHQAAPYFSDYLQGQGIAGQLLNNALGLGEGSGSPYSGILQQLHSRPVTFGNMQPSNAGHAAVNAALPEMQKLGHGLIGGLIRSYIPVLTK